MSAQNGFNLGMLVKRFASQDYQGMPRYQVFSYVLNPAMDKIQENPRRPYGMVFPVGSFDRYKDAKEHRDKIAIETKAATFICECGDYKSLSLIPDENTVVTPYHDKTTEKEMQADIEHKEKQIRERRQRLDEEVERRSDPDTPEYFMQELYQYTARASRIKEAEVMIANTKLGMDVHVANVKEFIMKNPDILSQWTTTCKARYEEFRELEIYDLITVYLEKFLAEMRDQGESLGFLDAPALDLAGELDMDPSVVSEFDSRAQTSSADSDDQSDESFKLTLTAAQIIQNQASLRQETAATTSTQPAQTEHQKWSQVLAGEKTLTDFKDEMAKPDESAETGWIKIGAGGKPKKSKPTPRSQNFRISRGRGGKRGGRKIN